MQWRVTAEGGPCRFLVFGRLVLGEREFANAGTIEIDSRRKQFAFRPDPDELWGQHYPNAVYRLVTSTPECVEALGGDELHLRRRQTPIGRLCLDPHLSHRRVRLRRGRFVDRCEGSGGLGEQVRSAGRRCDPPGVSRPQLAQHHPGRSHQQRDGRSEGGRHDLSLARSRRDGASYGPARPRAVHGRRLGHARRLPGPAGTPPLARARRAGKGDSAHCLCPAIRKAGRLAAMVHARALFAHAGQERAWRRHRLAAEGPVRLCRSDRRSRLSRRKNRLARRGRSAEDRACRFRRNPYRQVDRDRSPAFHPRHAPRPIRRRGLERFASAGRSVDARQDGEQLDGGASLSAAPPLRRKSSVWLDAPTQAKTSTNWPRA